MREDIVKQLLVEVIKDSNYVLDHSTVGAFRTLLNSAYFNSMLKLAEDFLLFGHLDRIQLDKLRDEDTYIEF